MFKEAIFHYPSGEKAKAAIRKEIAAFRCSAVVKYVESLDLNDVQIDILYKALAKDIAAVKKVTEIA